MNAISVSRFATAAKKGLALLLAVAFSVFLLTACSSGAQETQEAGIDVKVCVVENKDAGISAQEVAVEVPEGATAYDALEASGLEFVASDSDYGKFIESIVGVANGDFGETSWWLYTANGEEVTVGCDSFELTDGDSIEWTYYL